MALNDPQSTFPVIISSFGTSSGFVLPTGGTSPNNATISNGSLVLTPNATSKAGIGVYGTPLPVDNGVQITFSYTSSGGSGADGIGFFVLDPSQVATPSTIVPGGYGGGLGYSDDGKAGITGGVLGIGFDTYGNFSAVDHGPQTGTGRAPNSVAIRGAGNASTTGYSLLDSASFTPGIDGNRIAKVTLIPSGSNTIVSVAISTDNGATFTTVINELSVAQALPSSVYYGFSASTGGSTDLHQINTMDVQLVVDPEVGPATVVDQTTSTTNPGTINPGDSVSYSYNVVNNGPNGSSQLTLTDDAPSNLINETYTIVDSLGTHTGTGAPDVSNLNLSNGATATVTVAGQIDPNATSGNISHVVTVVPSSAFVSSNPPGGTRAVSIGASGSSLYLQNADGVSSVAGSSGAVPIAPAAVVNDEASTTNTVTATVVEANTGLGALSLATGAPLSGTYSASTGILTFSGTSAQVQAELRDVQFTPAARTASSSPTPETYRITVTDSTTGQQAVETRAVTNIDGPIASGPVGAGMLADTATDAIFSGVSIADADNTSLSATVTVNAAHGDLTPGSAAGWTRSSSGTIVTYTRTYSASGTVAAAVQAGVRSLVFQPVAHSLAPGATEQDSFGLVVTDGAGISTPALSGTDTVTAAHDAPSVSGGAGGQSITDAQTATPFATTTVTDPDNTPLVETVTVNAAHGDLTAASSAGFARSVSGTLVSYTETFASTGSGTAAAAAQAALRNLVFQPVAHAIALGSTETDTVAASVTDGQGSTAASGTGTITVTPVHDTPALANPTAAQSITDAQTATPFSAATVTDPDDTSITLTATLVGTSGDLTAASAAGWTRNSATGTTTYTRSFAAGTGSAPAAQASLRNLVFQPTAHATAPGTSSITTFSAIATDSLGTSSPAAASVTDTVTAVHNAPSVSGGAGGQSITDAQTASPFAATTVADPDNTTLVETVTVNAAHGDLTAASSAGFARSVSGTLVSYTETFASTGSGTAAAAAQAALRGLVFQPTAHAIALGSTETDTVAASVTDGQGSTAASGTGTITVTPVHDAPSVSGGVGGQSITDAQTTSPFAATTVADPDNTPLVETVTVNAAHGDLTPASSAGFTRSVSGTLVSYTETFASTGSGTAAAAAQAALRGLVFQPVAHSLAPGATEQDSFGLVVTDGAGTSAPALSGTDTVTAAHDTPSVSGGAGGQSITDAQTATPFATTTVTDPDNTPLVETVTVNAAHGDLTAASSAGFARSVSGTLVSYTETFASTGSGTAAAAAQAALRNLVFQPVAHAIALGSTETDTVAASVTDGQGSTAASGTGTITVTPVHDTPALANPTAAQSITDAQTATPFATTTVADPDNTPLVETVTVNAAHGDLTAASSAGFARSVSGTLVSYTETFASTGSGTAAAAAQAALRGLVFQPTAHAIALGSTETDTVAASVTDSQGSTTASGTGTITVTPVHDTPSVSGGMANQAATAGSVILPFGDVAVTDPDVVGLLARVTVEGGASGAGTIVASSANGWVQTTQGTDTVLTRTFADASGVDMQLQGSLQMLAFTPGRAGLTGFDIQVTDDAASPLSSAIDSDNSVLTASSGPSVTGGVATQSTADVAALSPFAGDVVEDIGVADAQAGVTVVGGVASGDDLTAASTQGWTRTVQGQDIVYTRGFAAGPGEAGDIQAAVRGLVLQPAAHVAAPGTVHTTPLQLSVSDAFGTARGDTTVTVTAATDQPVLSGNTPPLAIADIETASPYAALNVSEPDYVGATATVTISDGLDQGDFTPASTAGFTRTVSGRDIVYTLTVPPQADPGALVQSAVRGLVFEPVTQAPGTTEQTAITLQTTFGGLTSPPVRQVVVTSGGALYPYPELYAQNSNPDAIVTVTANLPPGTAGYYATLGIGTVGPDPLTYTVTGNAVQVTAALHAVTFVLTSGTTLPGSYNARITGDGQQSQLVDLGTGNNQLSATNNNDTVLGGPGFDTIFGGATTTSVLIGGTGNNVFVAAAGATTAFDGMASSTFYGGSGDAVMIQGSGNDTFFGGTGNATVFGGSGSTLIYGSAGTFNLEGATGAATLVAGSGFNIAYGGAGSLIAYGNGSGLYEGGASGGNVIISGAGSSTLVGGGNADQLVLVGNGTDLAVGGAGHETIAGAGATGTGFYFSGTDSTLIAVGSGQSTVVGGPGSDTIFAGQGSGALTFFGGRGNDLVVGNAGSDAFVVGSGNETLVGSGGRNTLVVQHGAAGGNVTVLDFNAATDRLNLFGYTAGEVSGALAQETVSGGNLGLMLADGTRLTFVGVTDISHAVQHGNDRT